MRNILLQILLYICIYFIVNVEKSETGITTSKSVRYDKGKHKLNDVLNINVF